jgi:hypothetical protein
MMDWNGSKYSEVPDWMRLGENLMKLGHLPFNTTRSIELALTYSGVKRLKIVKHDCHNVDIFISQQDRLKIDGVIDNHGIDGVKYNIHDLPFWECRIKKYKVEQGKG